MNYNFIKDNFSSFTDGLRVNEEALKNYVAFNENGFILKHNLSAISEILKFLNSSNNIFILNGFMGSGKTYIADNIINFIDDNVLIFKNSYQEAINLDDVLLSMFRDFSNYVGQKKVTLPKVESSIFSDKINAYIKYCDVPMLFIFDSFEINMRNKDTQKDVLDFINYLSHFEKIKIIICSRTFKQVDLLDSESSVSVGLEPLSLEEIFEYLTNNSITGSNYEIEELYKATRGHYLLLELSVLIMNIFDISLNVFSTEYKKSSKNYLEFLITKMLSVTPEKFDKLLMLLAMVRHGLSEDFLINNEIAAKDDIEYLLQKRIIAEKFNQYYLKDYMKNEYIKSVTPEKRIKVHESLIKIYEDELPLKPFDRQLYLSRQTMRQEISFHKEKAESIKNELTKTGRDKLSEMQDFNYLSYSKTSGYEKGMEKQTNKRYIKKLNSGIIDKRKRFELTNEDSLLLNTSSNRDDLSKEMNRISDVQNDYNQKNEIRDNSAFIDIPKSLDDYVEIAQNYENAFNFPNAIMYYKKALTYNDDELFIVKEPIIYTKLAICYKKIQNLDEAVRMYEKVYELYLKESVDKANNVLLSIAQIYNEVYKFDKVKEVYNRILYSPNGVSPQMAVRVYLDLSELEDNNLDIESAVKYVQKALNEAEKLSDVKLLTECYFKYALLLDDSSNIEMARKYYLRCIQTSQNPEENVYLSSAYSNMAELALDDNNVSSAKMYFELSVEADKKMNNNEGLYYSYRKLAELYREDSPEKRYETLVKALSAAKHFDDVTYPISVYCEIGAYYFEIEDFKHALKSYILAKTLLPRNGADDINQKLNNALNRIKITIGDSEFNRLTDEIKKKR